MKDSSLSRIPPGHADFESCFEKAGQILKGRTGEPLMPESIAELHFFKTTNREYFALWFRARRSSGKLVRLYLKNIDQSAVLLATVKYWPVWEQTMLLE